MRMSICLPTFCDHVDIFGEFTLECTKKLSKYKLGFSFNITNEHYVFVMLQYTLGHPKFAFVLL